MSDDNKSAEENETEQKENASEQKENAKENASKQTETRATDKDISSYFNNLPLLTHC